LFDQNEVRGTRWCSVYRIGEGGQVMHRSGARSGAPIVRDRSEVGAHVEQASRFAQIESVESLVEPLIDREDEIT
jgi:hypothetical protein